MKKGCLIALCICAGLFVLIIVASYIIPFFFMSHALKDVDNQQLLFYDNPVGKMEIQDYKVEKVVSDSTALAIGKENGYSGYYGLSVLLLRRDGTLFYDGEIVKSTKDQSFVQIGVCKYKEHLEEKNVPIITLMDN